MVPPAPTAPERPVFGPELPPGFRRNRQPAADPSAATQVWYTDANHPPPGVTHQEHATGMNLLAIGQAIADQIARDLDQQEQPSDNE